MNTHRVVLFCVSFACTAVAVAAPVTNADIEKLLAAGMDDAIILNVISGGEANFDTSPDALIALKQKGASPAVLAALTGRREKVAPAAPPPAAPSAIASMEEIASSRDAVFIDGERRTVMQYFTPEFRVAGKITGALTMGILHRSYWVMEGPSSQLRTKNRAPKLMVTVPRNAKPEQIITLTFWATRTNGTREIMAQRVKFTPGDSERIQRGPDFPKERVIPVSFTAATNESGSPILGRFEVCAKSPLAPGEYALVIQHQAYDFGVD